MFDHLSTRAADRVATERFYDAVLPPLGIAERHAGPTSTLFGNFELSVGSASPDRPTTTGLHLGLSAPSREAVDAFWQAGVDAGYRSDGAPGPRPQYVADYYGAFLLDPDGNSIEAAHHARSRARGLIDHAWLGAADLAAQRDFLLGLAEHAGLTIAADESDLIRVRGPRGGSLTITSRPRADGSPRPAATGVHVAIPAARPTIDAWHAAALTAGYVSDGSPGPRDYHPGYYGAFVLDPAGWSYELVDHDGVLGERW